MGIGGGLAKPVPHTEQRRSLELDLTILFDSVCSLKAPWAVLTVEKVVTFFRDMNKIQCKRVAQHALLSTEEQRGRDYISKSGEDQGRTVAMPRTPLLRKEDACARNATPIFAKP
jgi:hypothetical protein